MPSLDVFDDNDLGELIAKLDSELHQSEARRVRSLEDLEAQLSGCEAGQ